MHWGCPEEICETPNPAQQPVEDEILRVLAGRVTDIPGEDETRSKRPGPADRPHLPHQIGSDQLRGRRLLLLGARDAAGRGNVLPVQADVPLHRLGRSHTNTNHQLQEPTRHPTIPPAQPQCSSRRERYRTLEVGVDKRHEEPCTIQHDM